MTFQRNDLMCAIFCEEGRGDFSADVIYEGSPKDVSIHICEIFIDAFNEINFLVKFIFEELIKVKDRQIKKYFKVL